MQKEISTQELIEEVDAVLATLATEDSEERLEMVYSAEWSEGEQPTFIGRGEGYWQMLENENRDPKESTLPLIRSLVSPGL